MPLVYKNEKPLFVISLIISSLFWLGLLIGTMGMLLGWVLIIFLFYLFAHSGFIAYLKGNAVKVTEQQYPDLYRMHQECCARLEMDKIPELYLLCSDGMLNALATRFLRKNFVVLFSDIVDALDERPEAVRFYIGHELGHIARNHLGWGPVLLPASILPLLGAAYSRAREYTCDLHGLACASNKEDAMYAMAVLAAGEKRWQNINFSSYLEQVAMTSGFWMSFHELIADYPWLSKRMARIAGSENSQAVKLPGRHKLAWLFALFVPRTGARAGGGIVSVLIVVAIIGILAAIAIPAYQEYISRTQVNTAWDIGLDAQKKLEDYIIENNKLPDDLSQTGFSVGDRNVMASYSINQEGAIVITFTGAHPVAGQTLLIQPYVENERLYWRCDLGTLTDKLRPKECLSQDQGLD
ncbi:MAG: M48 family metallopeptidase [Thiohalophilus sp.]|jgi:Zn-dependent protease with chaperone function/Tfp pilus assembly protein PilE